MQIIKLTAGLVSTNTYIVSDGVSKGAAVIDPDGDAEAILSAAADGGLTISAILLTHGHFDHIGAVDALCERTGAPVYLSEADGELLSDGEKNASMAFLHRAVLCHADTVPLHDGDTVRIGALSFYVRATAGHTRGSAVFFVGEDAVFTGDTVFAYGHGRTDLYGGDEAVMTDTLKWLSPMLAGRTVYPGHGPAKRKK